MSFIKSPFFRLAQFPYREIFMCEKLLFKILEQRFVCLQNFFCLLFGTFQLFGDLFRNVFEHCVGHIIV